MTPESAAIVKAYGEAKFRVGYAYIPDHVLVNHCREAEAALVAHVEALETRITELKAEPAPLPLRGLKDHQIARLVTDVTSELRTHFWLRMPHWIRGALESAVNASLDRQEARLDHLNPQVPQ